jgi:hypothetical protein
MSERIEVRYGDEVEEIVIEKPPIEIKGKPGEPRFLTFYSENVKKETGIDYKALYDEYAKTRDPEDYKKLVDAYSRLVGEI